jgi:hypothetical protein
MGDLSDDALDGIERAFRSCQADHGPCKHEMAGYHLVQDLGPALVQEVRRLRGLISDLPTLDGSLNARRVAEEFRRRQELAGPEKKGKK